MAGGDPVNIQVNGRSISCKPGETVLAAASKAGIHIPHLCAMDMAPTPHASCRVCLVEVDGEARLQTSCTLAVREGMSVRTHSPKALRIRRNIVELLLASHPDDCLYCERAGDCELSRLATSMDIRGRRFGGGPKGHPIDVSSPAIVRDPNKCVLCGRCVTVCHSEQRVGAIDYSGRGFNTLVKPGADAGLDVSDCVFCGQCVRVCPTGALREKSAAAEVSTALGNPQISVVAQIAPAVPATIAAEVGLRNAGDALALIAGALRQIGFDAVYDTSFTADLTVMEEAHELLDRLAQGGPIPMFTSCSPAWVRFVELHKPQFIPNLSTCKSPQQMAATLIKRRGSADERRIFSVAIMPCTAKKHEAFEVGDLDAVLTTRELIKLLDNYGVKLTPNSDVRSELDEPFAEASGAGRLFGGSGGVLEAALRTAAHLAGESNTFGSAVITPLRSSERVRTFAVTLGGKELHCAVVSGLGAARTLLDEIEAGKMSLDFVEVMSCAGGCIGGGGQPRSVSENALEARRAKIHDADKRAKLRCAHENPAVLRLYTELLGAPGSHTSHELLHRRYINREVR
jgi:iron-only hydrogenase group A